MQTLNQPPDVIVIGGGIAGLAAALRLQDRGLRPLVLEAGQRVGGRMTTDRADGFVIDRGVTLLGNHFHRMKHLVARLGLEGLVRPVKFSVGVHDEDRCRVYRAGRLDDLLFDRNLSLKAKIAALRLGFEILWNHRTLAHGCSDRNTAIDSEDTQHYHQRIGGEELFDRVCGPAFKGAAAESIDFASRAIFMQTTWNLMIRGIWTLTDGLDRIPEAIAERVPVRTAVRVNHVEFDRKGAQVEIEASGGAETLHASAVIFAIPGNFVPRICPGLPAWVAEPLSRTKYGRMVNAAVALNHPPRATYAGCTFSGSATPGVVLELEHLRAPRRCPEGKGLVCAFLWDTPEVRRLDSSDESLQNQAAAVVEKTFPECKRETMFVHLTRWDPAIAHFPVGRLREMGELRRRLGKSDLPIDFCGDYLDGLSSEGALRTGEQAADRTAERLRDVKRSLRQMSPSYAL